MITKRLEEIIKSPNSFEQDFAGATKEQREKIVSILRNFMVEIRKILDNSGRMTRIMRPEIEKQCATCAFNPKLDNLPGFAPTAYGLLYAIWRDNVFICHENQSAWKQNLVFREEIKLCNGFESIRLFSGTKSSLATAKAFRSIREVFPKKK